MENSQLLEKNYKHIKTKQLKLQSPLSEIFVYRNPFQREISLQTKYSNEKKTALDKLRFIF